MKNISTTYTSIIQILQERANLQPYKIAYTYLTDGEHKEEKITYRELHLSALSIANELQIQCKTGDRALLFFPQGLEFIKAFLGCLYTGLIAVPSYPPKKNRHNDKLTLMYEDCQPEVILTLSQAGYGKAIEKINTKNKPVIAVDQINEKDNYEDLYEVSLEDIAFIQYTSGSTGNPKGVMVSHGNLMHNENLIQKSYQVDKDALVLGWLPFYHDMGLIGNILQPIFAGVECVLMAPIHFLQKPARWLQAISKYKATTSGGPNFAFDLCVEKISEDELTNVQLDSWKVAFNGAEPVRAKTLNSFSRKFKNYGFSKKAFMPSYGMAETTLLISTKQFNCLPRVEKFYLKDLQYYQNDFNENLNGDTIQLVSCGVCNDYNYFLVDENGNICKPGNVGELWLQGKSVAKGYWNKQIETREIFGGNLVQYKGNYLKTGDLAVVRNNELFIVGRLKDLIIINGRNYYPQDIEQAVTKANKDVVNESVAAFGVDVNQDEKLVVVAEVEFKKSTDFSSVKNSVLRKLAEEFEFTPHDIKFIRKGTIPKTTSGKIQRKACKTLYLNENLNEVVTFVSNTSEKEKSVIAAFNEKESEIVKLLKEECKTDNFSRDTDLFSIGLDSIQLTRFTYRLSDFYNKEIPVDFILEHNSIEKIAKNIDALGEQVQLFTKQRNNTAPATGLQELIWFNQQRRPQNTGYNIPVILDFDTEFNITAIKKTLGYILKNHEIYRTNFRFEGEELLQVINNYTGDIICKDLSFLSNNEFKEQYAQCIKQEASECFDLQNDQLIKIVAMTKPGNIFSLLFVIHHIIVDGASVALLLKEFREIYFKICRGESIPESEEQIRFLDFAANYRKEVNETAIQSQKEFWYNQFQEKIKPLQLPFQYSKDLELNREGNSFYFELEKSVADLLKKAVSTSKNNQYSFLLSAYYLLLHQLTGEIDLIIGAPVSLRSKQAFRSIHGLLINTSMLRIKLDTSIPLNNFVDKVYQHTREVLKYADYPFNQLLRDLHIAPGEDQLAVTSVFFNYLDFASDGKFDEIFNAYKANPGVDLNFDLNLYALPTDDSVKFRLDYCKHHIQEESIKLIAQLYIRLLKELIKGKNKLIADIQHNIPEKTNTLVPSNSFEPFCENDIQLSIVEKFHKVVQQFPQHIAIKTNEKEITYQELDSLTNCIASLLAHKTGSQKASGIGLLFGHEINMISSILGVLKTGNYYVPLDNEYPFDRLSYIIKDAGIGHILTTDKYYKKALELSEKSAHNLDIINIDQIQGKYYSYTGPEISSGDLAYILYTSGSTGTPKGVMQTHEYVMHLTQSFTNSLHISKDDCFTLIPSFNFSASVMDLFGVLLNGASLYLVDIKKEGVKGLLEGMKKQEVTVYHSVPTVFRAVCEEIAASSQQQASRQVSGEWSTENACSMQHAAYSLKSLRLIYLAGEPLLKNDVDRYKKLFHDDVILVNGLGCTEFNICRQFFANKNTEIKTSVVPIGYKAIGVDVLIVDRDRKELKNFQPGEIAIRSRYLSKGYWNSPELTDSKFKVVDSETNDRIYYTGDLGQKTVDGCLLHLGRKDFQVKLRGQRIELAEIESALLKIEGIKRAISVLRQVHGVDCLCGYFMAEKQVSNDLVAEKLKQLLPGYMIPAYLLQMESFPLTDTGKVDRKSLPIPVIEEKSTEHNRLTETESQIQEIWAEVLKVNRQNISKNTNFFEVGGNSLSAIQMMSRINETLNTGITLSEVFQNPELHSIAQLLGQKEITTCSIIPKAAKQEYYPLSSGQKSLWVLSQMKEASVAYNLNGAYHVKGNIDVKILEEALFKLIDKYEILRTIFIEFEGEPVMKVIPSEKVSLWKIFELEEVEKDKLNSKLDFYTTYPFELDKGPLFKIILFKTNKDEYTLLYIIHHLVADGWSAGIFIKELIERYKGNPTLVEPDIQYKDYTSWLESQEHIREKEKSKVYWSKKLAGDIPVLELPHIYPRPAVQTYKGDEIIFNLDESLTQKLDRLAYENDATLFMVLVSILKILFYKYTGQTDIILGTDNAGRTNKQLENQIGYFLNLLPLRTEIENTHTFSQMVSTVKKSVIEAFENQDYPIDEMVRDLKLVKDPSRSVLFDVLVLLQNFSNRQTLESQLEGVDITEVPFENKNSLLDLTFEFIQKEKQIDLKIRYNTDLFQPWQINNFYQHFVNLLDCISASRNIAISELSIINEAEVLKIRHEFNSVKEYDKEDTVIQLFKRQVEICPEDLALECGETKLSYKELSTKAASIANSLLAEHQIKPEDRIGLLMNKNENAIISVLGVLMSGAAYVPIDIANPKARIEEIIEDSSIKIVISDSHNLTNPAVQNRTVINIEKVLENSTNHSKNFIPHPVSLNNLAYILYTSGSTGKPKGVMIEHGALADYVQTFANYFSLNKDDCIIQQSSLSFDTSIEEIFPILTQGGKIQVIEQGGKDVETILSLIENCHANILSTTPLVINELNLQSARTQNLRLLISGGDVLRYEYLNKLIGKYDIYNTYGPTEATVCASYQKIETKEDIVKIGKPISNKLVIIRNKDQQEQTVGVEGEICIAGNGLFREYLNQPDITKKSLKYIDNNTRVYCTGDKGFYLPDGSIVFKGRIDEQIKIRGIRVEIGEIESVIKENEGIMECVVIGKSVHGDNSLVALYTLKNDEQVEAETLKNKLSETLPSYMIPEAFVQLEELPRTGSGKVDRKKLEGMSFKLQASSHKQRKAPDSKLEADLLEIWSEVIGVAKDQISIDDNFFEIGGHSLKATRLIYKIQEKFHKKIDLKHVFSITTIEGQAKLLIDTSSFKQTPIIPVLEQEHYELSGSQKRLWILSQLEGGSVAYNMPFTFRLKGELNINSFKKAIYSLIERHESLRTIFIEMDGEPRQIVLNKAELSDVFNIIPLEKEKNNTEQINTLLKEFIHEPFDLTKGPLMKLILFRQDKDTHILLFNLHHIISDGWSMDVIVRDLLQIYQSLSIGNENPLQPLKIQYKDYATWSNYQPSSFELQASREYWKKQFKGEIPVLDFPTDRPRGKVQTYNGDQLSFEIDKEITAKIKSFCQQENITLFMALLAFVKTLLYRYTQQNDIVVGVPVAGREHAGLEDQVGFYVNTLALRTQFEENTPFKELLKSIKETTLGAYEHQSYGFDKLVDDLQIQRDFSRSPLFDIMVVLQNTDINSQNAPQIEDLQIKPYETGHIVSKFDVTFNFVEQDDSIRCDIEYNTDLFDADRFERLQGHFLNTIQATISYPEIRINEFDILTEVEKSKILYEFNDTETDYPREKTVMHLFEEALAKYPDNIALEFENDKLNYKEFNQRIKSLANAIKQHNIGKEDIVGIIAERSIEMVVSIFSIIKAGAAYLPIDPSYPIERISYILKDSEAKLVITNTPEITKQLSSDQLSNDKSPNDQSFNNIPTINLNTFDYNTEYTTIKTTNHPTDLAYVIYTSGSTGKPKGVMIEHQSLTNVILYLQKKYPLNMDDTYLFKTTYTFDVSVVEIFGWYLNGGKLTILKPGAENEPDRILETIKEKSITHINFVPSMFSVFLESCSDGIKNIPKLEYFFLAGEALPANLVRKFKALNSKIQLENIYGPTETTIYACAYSLEGWTSKVPVYIGKPVDNVRLYVVNKNNKLQPIGVPGELLITGESLARGYLKNVKLNKDKFIEFTEVELNAKAYKTGDKVSFFPDGNIEYHGRIDNQVKIRGFRIELGEIEKCLEEHVDIMEAVVITTGSSSEDKRIVAYCIVQGSFIKKDEVKSFLKEKLPYYMIPEVFIHLKEFPKTISGKVDRKKLPLPGFNKQRKRIAPRNKTEEKLIEIYSEVLEIPTGKISVDDNFFELGGNSLRAIKLVSNIRKILHSELPVNFLLNNPNLIETAKKISDFKPESNNISVGFNNSNELSFAQNLMWKVISSSTEANIAYNITFKIYLKKSLDLKILKIAILALLKRHEILYSKFTVVKNTLCYNISSAIDEILFEKRIKNKNELDCIFEKDVKTPFKLIGNYLCKIELVEDSYGMKYMLFKTHHFIMDGFSLSILFKDLFTYYENLFNNVALKNNKMYCYNDFVEGEKRKFSSKTSFEIFWENKLKDVSTIINFPTDFPRQPKKSYLGENLMFEFNKSSSKNIRQFCDNNGISEFSFFISAFNLLIHKITGQKEIVICTPFLGRNDPKYMHEVGLYIKLTPFISKISKGTIYDYMKYTERNYLEFVNNQIMPYIRLVEKYNIHRNANRAKLFDAAFAWQTAMSLNNESSFLNKYIDGMDSYNPYAKHDIALDGTFEKSKYVFRFNYDKALFQNITIQTYIIKYKEIVSYFLNENTESILKILK